MIKLGDENQEVANWQRFLISQGYEIEADGDFGAKTETATKDFQANQNLRADGIVGQMTLDAAQALKPQAIGSIKANINNDFTTNNSKLIKVHPNLAKRAAEMIALAYADGFNIQVSQGLRTFAEQDALFRKRPKVTNAKGGQSMHNYGLAVDFVFIVNGKVSWEDSLYDRIGDWANSVGLEWGGDWSSFKDRPHCQLKNLPSYKVLLPIFNQGGLRAVWEKYQG